MSRDQRLTITFVTFIKNTTLLRYYKDDNLNKLFLININESCFFVITELLFEVELVPVIMGWGQQLEYQVTQMIQFTSILWGRATTMNVYSVSQPSDELICNFTQIIWIFFN